MGSKSSSVQNIDKKNAQCQYYIEIIMKWQKEKGELLTSTYKYFFSFKILTFLILSPSSNNYQIFFPKFWIKMNIENS